MPASIGVLHSTGLTSSQTAAIKAGLLAKGWGVPSRPYSYLAPPQNNNGRYGRDQSGNPIHDLNDLAAQYRNQNVNLFIAAGGLVSALAAYDEAALSPQIKMVCLIGRMPTNHDDAEAATKLADQTIVRGKVDLNTPSKNIDRLNALVAQFPAVNAATVALLVNTNSKMWEAEVDLWSAGGANRPVLLFPNLANRSNNDHAHFNQFFMNVHNVPGPVSAIVVSSDPFFYWYRTRLIKAAQNFHNVPICFPFTEYKYEENTTNPLSVWTTQHIVLTTPELKLLDQYKELGSQAGKALDEIFPIAPATTLTL